MEDRKLLGCGMDHNVFVSECGKAFVWGSSASDKLGLSILKGDIQQAPYEFPLAGDENNYSAISVSCGDNHTAMIISDTSLKELKLIHSKKIDITGIFQAIIENFKNKNQELNRFHNPWDKSKYIDRGQLTEFFKVNIPEEYFDNETQRDEQIARLVKLMMKGDNNHSMLYKEFRDQLYGTRLDEGRVITWGANDNHQLGRKVTEEVKDEVVSKLVEFPYNVAIVQVSCGGAHTLALTKEKKVYAWGANSHGQLGVGDTIERETPQQVGISAEFLKEVAGGGFHSLALDSEGHVHAWGLGEGGRLGLQDSNLEQLPKQIPRLEYVKRIAAGHSHSGCIVGGEVYTWGMGTYGRLGHGSLDNELQPRIVEAFRGMYITKLVLSFYHSAALDMNGEVWTWGNSKDGRLGYMVPGGENQLVPIKISSGTLMSTMKIIDLALGFNHGLAVSKQGKLFAWGSGSSGKLGYVSKSSYEPIPKEVKITVPYTFFSHKVKRKMAEVSTKVFDFVCSDLNTYVVTDAGVLLAFGSNRKGQLACSSRAQDACAGSSMLPLSTEFAGSYSSEPVIIDKLQHLKVKRLSAYGEHVLIISETRTVYVWGANDQGELGHAVGQAEGEEESKAEESKQPKRKKFQFESDPKEPDIFKGKKFKVVAAGANHSAFLTEDGGLFMCGNSEAGRLGLGEGMIAPNALCQAFPRQLTQIPSMKRISCGSSHTAAIDHEGNLLVWGSGWSGKLGLDSMENAYTPQFVPEELFRPPLNDVHLQEVACGESHTLVLTRTGFVYAAGVNKYAGIDSAGNQFTMRFQQLSKITQPIKQIASHRDHSLAVTKNGEVLGWGSTAHYKLGEGPFPPGPMGDSSVALPGNWVHFDKTISKVDCGMNHSAALTDEGSLYVWGSNAAGRLGLGKNCKDSDVKMPVQVRLIKDWLETLEKPDSPREEANQKDEGHCVIQSLLKNEPSENNEDILLSDDQALRLKFEELLQQYDQVREIENTRSIYQSQMENLIASHIAKEVPHNPKVDHSLPGVNAKNIQLYEKMIACLQAHPCYVARIIQHNLSMADKRTAKTIVAIYGDLRSDNIKMRRLMMLFKIVLQQSVDRAFLDERAKFAELDLASSLYFSFLESEKSNTRFFTALTSEIIKIIYKVLNNMYKKSILSSHTRDQADDEATLSLNFAILNEWGDDDDPYHHELQTQRWKLFLVAMHKIQNKIIQVLSQQPTVRQRFGPTLKLTEEIRFLFKEIPNIYKRKLENEPSLEKRRRVCNARIVELFFLSITRLLREPVKMTVAAPEEFRKSFESIASIGEQKIDISLITEKYSEELIVVANELDRITNRIGQSFEGESTKQRLENNDEFLEKLAYELTKERELNLTDLTITDLLRHSLRPRDTTQTILVSNLLDIHLFLYNNLNILRNYFPPVDPVMLILEHIGPPHDLFMKLGRADMKRYKLNLTIPSRWLLYERGLQSCSYCKTPLTHSLVADNLGMDKDTPLIFPEDWHCWRCGSSHVGWSMRCTECEAVRRDFPPQYVFTCFKQTYTGPRLEAFTSLLKELPPLPDGNNFYEFFRGFLVKNHKKRDTKDLCNRISVFLESIERGDPSKVAQAIEPNDIMKELAEQLHHEVHGRSSHREFLNNMISMIQDISSQIGTLTDEFQQRDCQVLEGSLHELLHTNEDLTLPKPDAERALAQGRFTYYYLNKKKILLYIDLNKNVKKNTVFYFSETRAGDLDVSVVLREKVFSYTCMAPPLEVKLMGFAIPAEQLQIIRRTMNLGSTTTFCDGSIRFDNKNLVRLLAKMFQTS